jgi:aryl-alcohol dehydrogenase-like predicted oxidoreductase
MVATTRVPFGRTGLHITRVGFGAWAAGGSWGAQDDGESLAAMRRAVELGVNWIDTAPVYNRGHSEELVGRLLAELPEADRPYVFTKTQPGYDGDEPILTGDAASLRRGVEDSLRRLGVERLDLLQMHWPADDETPVGEYWSTMLALRDEGKVAHIGLSNHDIAQLDEAEAITHVETLQPPLSAIRRESAGDVVPWCYEHGTGVIVYSPMQAGLLTGTFSAQRLATLPEQDWRRTDEDFTEHLETNLALVEALRPIAVRRGVGVGSVAVAWTLAWSGVTAAIVGARSAAQVDGWIDAAELVLDAADLDEITDAISSTGAGTGPSRP